MTRHYGEMKNTPVYPIVLTQMTTDMFYLSETPPGPFLIHDLLPE